MTYAGGAIFVGFVGLAVYAVYVRARQHDLLVARRLIVLGGVLLPTVLLAALLAYGLHTLPRMLAPAPAGSLQVHVAGLQWWWRVRYQPPGAAAFETANEIVLPVGEPVQFVLESPDVVHSFWIPNLAGKMDMIPGRTTRLALTATRAGSYRGACAEYCGTSHAYMAFAVRVLDKPAFSAWLRAQASAAKVPSEAPVRAGHDAFLENGCGACHTVRGTAARGVIGPDLTHVGGRATIGAGRFPRSPETLARWLAHTDVVKPGVLMPSFAMLPAATLHDLSLYLESLR